MYNSHRHEPLRRVITKFNPICVCVCGHLQLINNQLLSGAPKLVKSIPSSMGHDFFILTFLNLYTNVEQLPVAYAVNCYNNNPTTVIVPQSTHSHLLGFKHWAEHLQYIPQVGSYSISTPVLQKRQLRLPEYHLSAWL